MKPGRTGDAARQLEALWASGTLTGLTDTQLLARFNDGRGPTAESAFRELIDRHGPMVLGVCRQILRRPDDADDAFQATFLVLVRKARSLRVGDSLAPWLYSVAYRAAHRARAHAARHRPGIEEELVRSMEATTEEAYTLDLRRLLQEELGRLPDKYRAPIVLCHLEGKSHAEAAQLLRWPVGTVSGRLSRGRQLLRSRLERRGVAVPSALLSASWLTGTLPFPPTAIVATSLDAATRFAAARPVSISISVLTLTRGVLRSMLLNKLRTISLAVLIVGAVSGGVGLGAHLASGPSRPVDREVAAAPLPTQTTDATPTPGTNPAPQSGADAQPPAAPHPSTSDTRLADCPTDCSATGSGDAPAGCPIAMAAHTLTRLFGQIHDSLVSSR